uniref:Uncharacterized protein n=1 Tax=Ficedula albicollis TaxID=59894 RepID=U3KLN1_FICAL
MLSWLHWGKKGLLLAAVPIPKSSESQEHCRPWPQPQGHEQAIALTVMFSSFLGPTGWVLANIHYYRSRPE